MPLWSQFAPDSGLEVGGGGAGIKALDARICHGLGVGGNPDFPERGRSRIANPDLGSLRRP